MVWCGRKMLKLNKVALCQKQISHFQVSYMLVWVGKWNNEFRERIKNTIQRQSDSEVTVVRHRKSSLIQL